MDNAELRARAGALFPGGVSSPVRSFKAVPDEPVPIARAAGARLYDTEGREYIDYVAAYGPLILGHAHAT
ncbi:MAG: aminotransferase class III-fold pyridoxal phosphate-dependent enzyme, partial [Dehalococcoidia bacterium]|nr:aminotransferase class III-fold pyridoxal phosphate-dependent enzyme [Dehalococcoidia bacterium]